MQALCSESSGYQQPNADGSTVQQYGAVQSDVDGTYDVSQAGGRTLITDLMTPVEEGDFELKWKFTTQPTSSPDYARTPSSGIVVGDHYYTRSGEGLYKLSIETGDVVAAAPSVYNNYMYGHWVDYIDYGDGLIVDNPNGVVYDLDLNPLYKITGSVKTFGHDGYMYVYSNSTGNLCKYDPDPTGLDSEDVKTPIWTTKVGESNVRIYYPVAVEGYIYYTDPSGVVKSVDAGTGEVVDSYEPEAPYDAMAVNNEMLYSGGCLYLSLYSGGIFEEGEGLSGAVIEIPIDESTGQMSDEVRAVGMSSANNNSSFLVYGGYGYMNSQGGFYVIDLETFEIVAQTEGEKVSRGNMSMTTYYDKEEYGNKVYLYVVPYTQSSTAGKVDIVVYECTPGDVFTVEKHKYSLDGTSQWCTEFAQFGPHGELIFHNDSGTVHCYGNVSAIVLNEEGDLNGDDAADLKDAMILIESVLGIRTLSQVQAQAADLNGDGSVDLKDALKLMEISVGGRHVGFSVTDSTGEALQSFDVAVYYDEAMSDAARGSVLQDGDYWYSVSARGYETKTGSFTVSGAAVTVEVELTALVDDDAFVVSADGILTNYRGPGGYVEIPETVGGVTVVSIGTPFLSDKSITGISIPSTVTSIDKNAFKTLALLERIDVDSANTAFQSLDGILYNADATSVIGVPRSLEGDITIPGTLGTIGSDFSGSKVESVYIEEGVTKINSYAFRDCSELTWIHLPDSLKTVSSGMFEGTSLKSLVIPAGVSINNAMIRDLPELETLVFLGGTSLPNLSGCTGIRNLILPDSLTALNFNTISDTRIVSLTIPAGVEVINASSAPETLKQMSVGDFTGSIGIESLQYLVLRDGFGSDALDYLKSGLTGMSSLKEFRLSGASGYSVEDGVLFDSDGTTLLAYPAGNTGDYVVPAGVDTIGATAFSGSNSIEQVTIGSSVTSIGESAFSDSSVKHIVFEGNVSPTIVSGAIPSSITVYVQDGFQWNGNDAGLTIGSLYKLSFKSADEVIGEFLYRDGAEVAIRGHADDVSEVWSGPDGKVYKVTDSITVDSDVDLSINGFGVSLYGTLMACTLTTSDNLEIPSEILGISVTTLPAGTANSSIFSEVGMSSVTIPDTVTTIGAYAFAGCSSMKSIDLPESITEISQNALAKTGLTSVVIPDSVTKIAFGAFSGSTELKNVTIGAGVTSIDPRSFQATLDTLTVSADNAKYRAVGTLLIDSDSMLIAYLGNDSAVTLPDSIVSIGTQAFYQNTVVKNVKIPNNVVSIGNYAFYGCTSLESIVLPESVKELGTYVFSGCTALKSAVLPDSITSIGERLFYECESLTSVKLPNGISGIANYMFYKCKSLTSVEIPASVTSIGAYAFTYSGLTSIDLPDGLKSMGNYAFEYCSALESVVIPSSVESMGSWVFGYCSALESVVFPAGLTLPSYTFYGCSGLKSVFFMGDAAPEYARNALPTAAVLYSHGSVSEFDWTGWDSYTKGTYWNVTFVVDGVEAVVPVPVGQIDLSRYDFTFSDGSEVTQWQHSGGTVSAEGSFTVSSDVKLTAMKAAA